MNSPTSHLAHLHTVPDLLPQDEHRQQWGLVDDYTGHCWLWRLSSRTTFVVAKVGLPTNLGVGQSWLFPTSSIKFMTRSLKSQWVYLAPREDNSIHLLSSVRTRTWKNNFMVHLKVCQLIE